MSKKSKTKKCNYCKSEIDRKAIVCPFCKRSLKKSHGCLITILFIIIIFSGGIIATISLNDSAQKSISGISDESEYITLDEFNQIKNGMSYKKVKKL